MSCPTSACMWFNDCRDVRECLDSGHREAINLMLSREWRFFIGRNPLPPCMQAAADKAGLQCSANGWSLL